MFFGKRLWTFSSLQFGKMLWSYQFYFQTIQAKCQNPYNPCWNGSSWLPLLFKRHITPFGLREPVCQSTQAKCKGRLSMLVESLHWRRTAKLHRSVVVIDSLQMRTYYRRGTKRRSLSIVLSEWLFGVWCERSIYMNSAWWYIQIADSYKHSV